MIDKLPYQLTEGVTATRDGIEIDDAPDYLYSVMGYGPVDYAPLLITWPDAAKWLWYRGGAALIIAYHQYSESLELVPSISQPHRAALNDIAAVLIGGRMESFRVLHWAIHNLGDSDER